MGSAAHKRIVMVGGGLAGPLLTTLLGRAGHQIDLYERRPDPAGGKVAGGRSINLALSTRGLDALERIGLRDEVMRLAVPMRGRMIHPPGGGEPVYQPYDRDPARCINSVSRSELNIATLAAARSLPNVAVHFERRCADVDLDGPAAEIVDVRTGHRERVAGDVLIGVDGAYSAVRAAMQRRERFDYAQQYLGHGYKELTIPPGPGGEHRMAREALHIWPRRSFMMIALPNPDGSFTCTLFYPFEGPRSFAALRSDADVMRFFEDEFPDAVPLMPDIVGQFRSNPTGSMLTVRCGPWHVDGRVVLVGDAAHAVVPFYGQGMNAAFEDCVVLTDCLESSGGDWGSAIAAYAAGRRPHAEALADLALMNFIEMRDKTGSRLFRAYKKLDRTLHGLAPGVYTPLYTMVSFTRTPYADAVRRARRQDRVVCTTVAALAILLVGGLLGWALGRQWVGFLAAAVLVAAVWGIYRRQRSRDEAVLREIGVRWL